MPIAASTVNQTRPGLYLGRPFRLPVYIGWSYLAVGVILISVAWTLKAQANNGDLPQLAISVWLSIGLVGFVQDLGHAIASRFLGGRMRSIALSGYGGTGFYKTLRGPRQFLSALAGPASSFAVAVFFTGLVSITSKRFAIEMLNPFWPPELTGTLRWEAVATVIAWVAVSLSVVQLLPIWQCDGRTMLDGLVATLRPHAHPQEHRRLLLSSTNVIAIGTVVCSIIGAMFEHPEGGVPKWPFVAVVAVLIWLSGRRSDARTDLLDEKDKRIGLRGWWKIRRAKNQEHREAVDASQVDKILERLHDNGVDSLSTKERAILDRVSRKLKEQRYGENGSL